MRIAISSKIILKTNRPGLLFAAVFGSLVGFLLAIISVQNYINFQYILKDKEQVIGSQYLVINKKVSLLNTLDLNNSAFNKNQIREIQTQPSVKNSSAFIPNQFYASAFLELSSGGVRADLQTDLFLESIGDEFIDIKSGQWKWSEGDEYVPVILPNDFINLYNFTYAPARGLPQISKSTMELFAFNLQVGQGFGKTTLKGKIIGFSNRISSMLVPISFMNYANQKFALNPPPQPAVYRLIVEVSPAQLSEFERFLAQKGYETNEELLRSGKISSLLHAILYIVFFIGIIMIINSLSAFVLYLRFVIANSKYDLENLLRLGFNHRKLTIWYANSIGIILTVIFFISIGLLLLIQQKTATLLFNYGFIIPREIHHYVFGIALLLLMVLYIIFYVSIKSQIFSIALPAKKNVDANRG